jgi:hypothetical protein
MPSLSADALFRAVEDGLRPRVTAAGGILDAASDAGHALELLATAPPAWRVILGWPGWGEHPAAREGMAVFRVFAIVQGPVGLHVRPGEQTHRGTPADPVPLMERIETVACWMRAMKFGNGTGIDRAGFSLTGSAWLDLEDIRTKQHQLDFEVAAALPPAGEVIEITA